MLPKSRCKMWILASKVGCRHRFWIWKMDLENSIWHAKNGFWILKMDLRFSCFEPFIFPSLLSPYLLNCTKWVSQCSPDIKFVIHWYAFSLAKLNVCQMFNWFKCQICKGLFSKKKFGFKELVLSMVDNVHKHLHI